MTISSKPLHNQHASQPNAGASARDVRRMQFHQFGRVTGPVTASDLAPSTPGGLQVEVGDGAAVIVGTEAAEQGSYFVENRGPDTVTLAPADPVDARHDLIVIRVTDEEYSGDTNIVELISITGDPSGIPADPAVPANSFVICRAVVPAGATAVSEIVDLRTEAPQSIALAASDQLDTLDGRIDELDSTVDDLSFRSSENTQELEALTGLIVNLNSTVNQTANSDDVDDLAGDIAELQSDVAGFAPVAQRTVGLIRSGSTTTVSDDAVSVVGEVSVTLATLNPGSQVRFFSDDIRVGRPETTGGSIDIQAAANKNVRLVNQAGVQGVGINTQGEAFLRPRASTASTNLLRIGVGAGEYGLVSVASSSERWKKKIEDLAPAESARVIRALRTITYRSKFDKKGDTDYGAGQLFGFSAENVHEIDPEMAALDDKGKPSGVDTEAILAHLVNHVRTLEDRIAELEGR